MKKFRLASFLLVLSLLLVALAVPVVAHEGREVGEYQIVFGWRLEPAYTNILNGPEFTVAPHGGGHSEEAEGSHDDTDSDHASDGITGLEDTLQIEVTYGGQSKILRLRAVYGEPGSYTADLIPTQPGDYSFRIFGKIGDVEVDETFDSSKGEFSTVEPITDIQFP